MTACLALHPVQAVLQLDFAHALNLVSRPAMRATIVRAFPLLSPYFQRVYGGDAAHVYDWGDSAGGDDAGR